MSPYIRRMLYLDEPVENLRALREDGLLGWFLYRWRKIKCYFKAWRLYWLMVRQRSRGLRIARAVRLDRIRNPHRYRP